MIYSFTVATENPTIVEVDSILKIKVSESSIIIPKFRKFMRCLILLTRLFNEAHISQQRKRPSNKRSPSKTFLLRRTAQLTNLLL